MRERLLAVAKALGLGLVFVVSLAGSLLLHSDLAPARRLVARELEVLLNDTFQGRFEIDSIDRFSRRTLRVSEVRVRDPKGVVVLKVKGLRVRVEAFDVLVVSLLSSAPKATVAFQHVRAERADVV